MPGMSLLTNTFRAQKASFHVPRMYTDLCICCDHTSALILCHAGHEKAAKPYLVDVDIDWYVELQHPPWMANLWQMIFMRPESVCSCCLTPELSVC